MNELFDNCVRECDFLQYPHVFEEHVLAKIRGWVMDENDRFPGEAISVKHSLERKKASDAEMLKTYSVGLFSIGLARYVSDYC